MSNQEIFSQRGAYLAPHPVNVISPLGKARDGKGFDASEDGTGRGAGAVAVACFKGGQGSSAGGIGYSTETAPTLTSADSGNRTPTALVGMQVRRLTPTEAERLQGFPDGQTKIPWRGKPADECPDGPRYKALGNSMAVPVMRWIGERIDKCLM